MSMCASEGWHACGLAPSLTHTPSLYPRVLASVCRFTGTTLVTFDVQLWDLSACTRSTRASSVSGGRQGVTELALVRAANSLVAG